MTLSKEAKDRVLGQVKIEFLTGNLRPVTQPQKKSKRSPHQDDATPVQRKLTWQGFTIGLQYRPGDKRHGRPLLCSYGHIESTRGADNMALDVYLGGDLTLPNIYEVDQHINGAFDEHKYIIGVDSIEAARRLYLSAMPPKFLGDIREVQPDRIKEQSK